MELIDESDEHTLACDMIEVHGAEAPTVARENARAAALAGQVARAKSWIGVLGLIQRRQANPSTADPDLSRSTSRRYSK